MKAAPFYVDFYDQDTPPASQEQYERVRLLARRTGGAVLEGMCGSGRFLVPLAQENISIDGLDICPHMLDACRSKLAKQRLQARLFEQDICKLSLPHSYSFIFIVAKSLSLADHLSIALHKIHAHLVSGGTFLFDLWGPIQPNRAHETTLRTPFATRAGSYSTMEQKFCYDPIRKLYRESHRLMGSEWKYGMDIRLYDRCVVIELLKDAGFASITCKEQSHFAKLDNFLFLKTEMWFECKKR